MIIDISDPIKAHSSYLFHLKIRGYFVILLFLGYFIHGLTDKNLLTLLGSTFLLIYAWSILKSYNAAKHQTPDEFVKQLRGSKESETQ